MNEIYQITGWQLVLSVIIFGLYCIFLQTIFIPLFIKWIKRLSDNVEIKNDGGCFETKWEDLTDEQKEYSLKMIVAYSNFIAKHEEIKQK